MYQYVWTGAANLERPKRRRSCAITCVMHSGNTDNGTEAGIVAERGHEVRRQIAHRVGADYGGGLSANSIERFSELFDVISAAPRALVPYANVVYADVVERARCGNEINLVLHIVKRKVRSVANPARNTLGERSVRSGCDTVTVGTRTHDKTYVMTFGLRFLASAMSHHS